MKVDLVTFFPDQTTSMRRVKVVGDHLKIRGHKPKLVAGKNVFPERPTGFWQKIGWKRKKRLVFWNYGCEFCFELDPKSGKLDDNWSTVEAERFINKVIAWAAAKTKLFSKFEIYVFWILLGICILMNFLVIRRIGI